MANTFLDLTIPLTNGAGASIDTSVMGKEKTVVVGGIFRGASIGIQISTDGVNFHTVTTMYSAGKKVIKFAASFMRVFVQNRNPASFTAFCTVGANDVGGNYAVLNVPIVDGVGVPTDISALGNFTTVTVGGDFKKTTLTLEVSEDGVNYAQCATFNAPGSIENLVFVANWARVRVSGRVGNTLPFSAQASIGATNDQGSGGGVPVVTTPNTNFVYQPSGGGVGPVVFEDWAVLDAALQAARVAGGPGSGGVFKILIDDTVVSPAVVPAGGPYDLTDCELWGRQDDLGSFLDFADGSSVIGLRKFSYNLGVTNRNTVTPLDASVLNGDVISVEQGSNINTITGGATFYDLSAVAPGGAVLCNLTEAGATGFSQTGTVFNCPAGVIMFNSVDAQGSINGQVYTGDPGALLLNAFMSLIDAPTSFPSFAGLVLTPRLDFAPTLLPNPYLLPDSTSSLVLDKNQWARLDVSSGPVAQTLPTISGSFGTLNGPGSQMWITESSGTVGLTIAPGGGDTIEGGPGPINVPPGGGVHLGNDGVNNWRVIASYDPAVTIPRVVVFRENGALASQGPILFDDWPSVIAQISLIRSVYGDVEIELVFDDTTAVAPMVIPPLATPYNMTNVTWTSIRPNEVNSPVALNIRNNVRFVGLRTIRGQLDISVIASLSGAQDESITSGDTIWVGGNANISCNINASFWGAPNLVAGQAVFFRVTDNASIGQAATPRPVIQLPVPGSILNAEVDDSATLLDNAFGTVAGGIANVTNRGDATLITMPQGSHAGTLNQLTVERTRFDIDSALIVATPDAVSVQRLARYNTSGGNITTNLPAANSAYRGEQVVVKNEVGANYLIVTAAGADTIDTTLTTVVLAPGQSAVFTSDSVTNWTALSGVGKCLNVTGVFVPGSAPVVVDIDDIARINASSNINVQLPAVSTENAGCSLILKKVAGAGSLRVFPAGVDTIDSIAGITTYAGALISIRLVSDGVSDWMVV